MRRLYGHRHNEWEKARVEVETAGQTRLQGGHVRERCQHVGLVGDGRIVGQRRCYDDRGCETGEVHWARADVRGLLGEGRPEKALVQGRCRVPRSPVHHGLCRTRALGSKADSGGARRQLQTPVPAAFIGDDGGVIAPMQRAMDGCLTAKHVPSGSLEGLEGLWVTNVDIPDDERDVFLAVQRHKRAARRRGRRPAGTRRGSGLACPAADSRGKCRIVV